MNKIDAAKWMTEMLPDTRVILFSGNAVAGDFIEQALADRFKFKVLSKPVAPQFLIDKVRGCILGYVLLARPERSCRLLPKE